MESKIAVSEVYKCLQGEVPCGVPIVLCRISGCNLDCVYCDSFYHKKPTWHLTPNELISKIVSLARNKVDQILFSGGEVVRVQGLMMEVCLRLHGIFGYFNSVETNGTIMPSEAFILNIHKWICSPKLKSSGNPKRKRYKPKVLHRLNELGSIFKFVVCNEEEDLKEIEHIIGAIKIPRHHVYLMPEGVTREKILVALPKLTQICLERGFNLSPRLHVLTFGNKRGV